MMAQLTVLRAKTRAIWYTHDDRITDFLFAGRRERTAG